MEFAGLAAGLGYLAYKEVSRFLHPVMAPSKQLDRSAPRSVQVMEIDSMKYQGDGDPDFTFFEEK